MKSLLFTLRHIYNVEAKSSSQLVGFNPMSANCVHPKMMFVHVSDRENFVVHQIVANLP